MLITNSNKKIIKISYIYYLVQFQEEQIRVLFNSSSKVNTINPNFA